MRNVSITASGYTWTCPECGEENYIGAAPQQVVCDRCQAQFEVADRLHRMVDPQEKQIGMFEVGWDDTLEAGEIDEIPF
jgi:hypothetical protein